MNSTHKLYLEGLSTETTNNIQVAIGDSGVIDQTLSIRQRNRAFRQLSGQITSVINTASCRAFQCGLFCALELAQSDASKLEQIISSVSLPEVIE